MHTGGGGGHNPMQRIVEVCLLVLLCGPDCERCHGYALGERLREFGFSDSEISVSTLYRTLRGMEEAEWVTSGWAEGGPGPQRREYAVTEAGRTALDEWAAVLQKRRERINRVLDEYLRLGREPATDAGEGLLIRRQGAVAGDERHRGSDNQPARKPEALAEKQPVGDTPTAAQRHEAENLHEYWD